MTQSPDEKNSEFLAKMLPHQRAIRNFIYSIHPHAGDIDDLMQETALHLWEKFDLYDPEREFLPWANRVAYFQVLRFRKTRSRDKLVFPDSLIEIMADEAGHEDLTESTRQALEQCLAQLPPRTRSAINARYSRGTSIADLAKTNDVSAHRLYRLLESGRAILISCVRRKLTAEGLPSPS